MAREKHMSINFGPDEIELLEEFTDEFDNRAEAARKALEYRLLIDEILGDSAYWQDAGDHERRTMLRQALVDYRRDYLDG